MRENQADSTELTDDFADDGAFRRAVAALLEELLDQIDALDSDDHDPSLTAGNLQVSFDSDGSVIVLSQQTPVHELWLSANRRAWHFLRSGGTWRERDTGEPLAEVLAGLFADKLGIPVRFSI